jgi:adenosylmethionine-8-amino-7-oxononanoate aminotransferase
MDALLRADRSHVWHPYTATDAWFAAPPPPVVEHAEGVWLTTRDGARFLDACGSWWVSNLGHGHPRIRAALHDQMERFSHVIFAGMIHEPGVELARRLVEVLPEGLERIFYSDNGSTAIEVAVRAAFQYWQQNGRPERTTFVSLAQAYHGDTIGTVSLGGIPLFHRLFAPLSFRTIQVPSPAGVGDASTWHEPAFDALEKTLRAHADTIAGVVVEPLIQGAGGMLMYPPDYLRALRALTAELDIFLIADEVFTGFGRTGRLFACDHAAITPDFLCMSKGLTGGFLPFAATATTARVFDGFRGDGDRTFFYGHSYCGNPLGCAAALAVLDTFRDDRVLEALQPKIERVTAWIREMAEHPGVVSARQTGFVWALQFGEESRYSDDIGARVSAEARTLGVWLRPLGNVVYLCPALTISPEDLEWLLAHVATAVHRVLPR